MLYFYNTNLGRDHSLESLSIRMCIEKPTPISQLNIMRFKQVALLYLFKSTQVRNILCFGLFYAVNPFNIL
jgi:hypothetical protein